MKHTWIFQNKLVVGRVEYNKRGQIQREKRRIKRECPQKHEVWKNKITYWSFLEN